VEFTPDSRFEFGASAEGNEYLLDHFESMAENIGKII
jgi:hypothetical protein